MPGAMDFSSNAVPHGCREHRSDASLFERVRQSCATWAIEQVSEAERMGTVVRNVSLGRPVILDRKMVAAVDRLGNGRTEFAP